MGILKSNDNWYPTQVVRQSLGEKKEKKNNEKR